MGSIQNGQSASTARSRTFGALAVVGLTVMLAAPARAEWPERTVTIVVPYAAGGNTDIMARMATDWLSSRIGRHFIVENRVGAGATLGAAYVAQAKPDGYTFLFVAAPQLQIAPLVQKVNYDPRSSFAPVATFGAGPQVLGVHPSVPAKNLRELIAYAKAHPGKLNYASGGQGTAGHLASAWLTALAGIDMVHVPYKGGSLATADLIGGQVQLYFGNASELLPHAGGDKLRLIAVSTPQRIPQLPNAEAVAETFAGFDMDNWNGFLAPAGTPRPILETMAREIAAATKDATIIAKLSELGILPGGATLEAFQKEIDDTRPAFEAAVTAAGMRMQ